MIGNLYTASLYLGFRSSLEFEYQKGVDLDGKRIGFGSYGSGSSAMVFSGVVQPEYAEIVKSMNLESEIEPFVCVFENEYTNLSSAVSIIVISSSNAVFFENNSSIEEM